MGLIFIRTIIVFITLLVIMRLMGKRQIGEMQPFELVITLLIAELACIPMADTSIPLLYGIVSILTIYFLHQIVCLLDLQFKPMKAVLSAQQKRHRRHAAEKEQSRRFRPYRKPARRGIFFPRRRGLCAI